MGTKVTMTIDTLNLHTDLANPLKYLEFKDDQVGDTYDDPLDKRTFDSYVDANGTVTWEALDTNGGELTITNIVFTSPPRGFFTSNPVAQRDGSWQATVGDNTTDNPISCEYTITFNDGKGDYPIPIDPKLQIRKRPK